MGDYRPPPSEASVIQAMEVAENFINNYVTKSARGDWQLEKALSENEIKSLNNSLITLLQWKPEGETGIKACWLLGKFKAKKAIEVLCATMRFVEDEILRQAAAAALAEIGEGGERVISALVLACTMDPASPVRQEAARTLALFNNPYAILELKAFPKAIERYKKLTQLLLDLSEKDPDVRVRSWYTCVLKELRVTN